MALMPSYATIGLIAPIAVFAARLLQGFAVAGEFGSSTAFMIEHSAHAKLLRQLAVCRSTNGEAAGRAVRGWAHHHAQWASTAHLGLARAVPFRLVGGTGRHVYPAQSGGDAGVPGEHPPAPRFARSLRPRKTGLLLGAGLIAVGTASTYFSHLHAHLRDHASAPCRRPPDTSSTIVIATLSMVLCPVAGNLADKIGYTRMMLPAAILMSLSSTPYFCLSPPPQPRHLAGRTHLGNDLLDPPISPAWPP